MTDRMASAPLLRHHEFSKVFNLGMAMKESSVKRDTLKHSLMKSL